VNDILSDQFLEMKKFLTEHLEKLQRDNEEMRSTILRQQQKYIEVIFKREDELRNSFEKQINEIRKRHEEQMESLRNVAPTAPNRKKFSNVGNHLDRIFK